MSQPTLRTHRLILRPFTLADAGDVQKLAGDKTVAEMTGGVPHPYLDGMAESWIKTHRKGFDQERQAVFAVTLVADGTLAGSVSLMEISRAHRHAELGYWIGRAFWNHGYASEAARALIRFGFSSLGLHRIHARCLKRNPASARVMEKAGMLQEGCLREHQWKQDRFEDILLYGLLASEFKDAPEQLR